MNPTRLLPLLALSALGALAACDDPTPPEAGSLTATEVADLSDAMVSQDFDGTSQAAQADLAPATDASASASPMTGTLEFTATWTCPLGGQIVVEGTHTREWDPAVGTGSSDLSLVKTHQACARPLGSTTITLDGDPNVTLDAHHAWQRRMRSGLQSLSLAGQLHWATADGREGTCIIDIQAAFDPETATRTVEGTFCNREVSITRTWSWNG